MESHAYLLLPETYQLSFFSVNQSRKIQKTLLRVFHKNKRADIDLKLSGCIIIKIAYRFAGHDISYCGPQA